MYVDDSRSEGSKFTWTCTCMSSESSLYLILYILKFSLWSSIIGVSDWTNDINSQSFASNLWNVSVRKENLSMYEIKTSYHGKCSIDFYSWVAMRQKTHLLAVLTHLFFLMHCSSWIKIVGVHFHGTISMIDAWKFSSTYN